MPSSYQPYDNLHQDAVKAANMVGVAVRFLRQLHQAAQTTDDQTVTVSINAIQATIAEMERILDA